MYARWKAFAPLFLLASLSAQSSYSQDGNDKSGGDEPAASEESSLKLAIKEQILAFEKASTSWGEKYQKAEDKAARDALLRAYPQPTETCSNIMKLVKGRESDPEAFSGLHWVYQRSRDASHRQSVARILYEHHLKNEALAKVLLYMRSANPSARKLAAGARKSGATPEIQGAGAFALANCLKTSVALARRLNNDQLDDAAKARWSKNLEGIAIERFCKPQAIARREKRALKLYKEVVDTPAYAAAIMGRSTLGQRAAANLFEMQNLQIGKVAPEIEGEDVHGKKFKLSDYRGQVVLLDFWGHW